ncbi:MAG: polysaccharide deacetylase family protein [Saprospiraceae bacterium]|nr:polysaccharide deacetylase family protein [Saprospiraceae bacterium]
MNAEILVLVSRFAPWVSYTFSWMGDILGWKQVHWTTDPADLAAWPGPAIAYTPHPVPGAVWLPDAQVIHPLNKRIGTPEVYRGTDGPGLFPVPHSSGIPFDLPASVFWMLSRAEEYATTDSDQHGRFPATSSLAAREKFLDQPVADWWTILLRDRLEAAYPGLIHARPLLQHVPSWDVDVPWRYRHRSIPAFLRAFGGDIRRLGMVRAMHNAANAMMNGRDPFDRQEEWNNSKARLFFPLGDKGPHDQAFDSRHPAYRELIRRYARSDQAGLHPSYAAAFDPEVLHREMDRYQQITGEWPERSRQHFLRFRIPETYRQLEAAGIKADWSMGYADQAGYRAGTAHPFMWFDLQRDCQTNLRVVPLVAMDVTLHLYMKLTPESGKAWLDRLWTHALPGGGTWVTLTHANDREDPLWTGWEHLFRQR